MGNYASAADEALILSVGEVFAARHVLPKEMNDIDVFLLKYNATPGNVKKGFINSRSLWGKMPKWRILILVLGYTGNASFLVKKGAKKLCFANYSFVGSNWDLTSLEKKQRLCLRQALMSDCSAVPN